MVSIVHKVANQAYQTFSKLHCLESAKLNILKLKDLMNRITAFDLGFDEELVKDQSAFRPSSGIAPVTYIHMWEDDCFSMGMFVLKNGTRLPLHDHPGMHGLIKVIHGTLTVKNYSRVDEATLGEKIMSHKAVIAKDCRCDVIVARELNDCLTVGVSSDVVTLDATEGNIHEIRAVGGPAAFLDILAPPYDDSLGSRSCSYYRSVGKTDAKMDLSHIKHCYLAKIPPPSDYWTDHAEYLGPDIIIDENEMA